MDGCEDSRIGANNPRRHDDSVTVQVCTTDDYSMHMPPNRVDEVHASVDAKLEHIEVYDSLISC